MQSSQIKLCETNITKA